ncbi:MAG: outer membrane beta-barrel protein [Gammaproteobacteria bacterium]|jgi:hypothetical protein
MSEHFGGRFLCKSLVMALTLAGAPSLAQTDETRPAELTLFAGLGFGGTFETESGDDVRLDDKSSLGIIFDFEEGPNTQWEFLYLHQDTAADTSELFTSRASIDTTMQYLQGGGTFRGNGERVRPYVAATGGLTRIDPSGPDTRSDTFWSFSVGGGAQFILSERLGIRLEGRVFGTFVDSSSAIYCGSVPETSGCLFILEGDALWQSHVFAGVTFRF